MTKIDKLLNSLYAYVDEPDQQTLEQMLDLKAQMTDLKTNNYFLKELVRSYAEVENHNYSLLKELEYKSQLIEADIISAKRVQESLFPEIKPNYGNFSLKWFCKQSDKMGGDLVNIIEVDDENVIFYIVDVCGHGLKAAMITVALSQFLNPLSKSISHKHFLCPSQVATELQKEFPFERFESFFTIIYGVLNTKTGDCKYCNCGHPYPIITDGQNAYYIEESNSIVGIDISDNLSETKIKLSDQNKLFFFSDGIHECKNPDGHMLGKEMLLEKVFEFSKLCSDEFMKKINQMVTQFCDQVPLNDDLTYLMIEKNKLK